MTTSHLMLRSMSMATRRTAVGYHNQSLPWHCHLSSSSSFSTTTAFSRGLSSITNNDDERGSANIITNRQHIRALPHISLDTKRFFGMTHTTSRSSSISTNSHSEKEQQDHLIDDDQNHPDHLSKTQQFKERYEEGKVKAQESYQKGKIKAKAGAKVAKKGAKTAAEMFKQYGPVAVGTYFTVYVTTLGSLFAGVDSGLIDPVTILNIGHSVGEATGSTEEVATQKSTVDMVVQLLEGYTFTSSWAPIVERNPHFANLAVAWVATKITEPIRLVVTMAITPRVARYFGRVPVDDEEEETVEANLHDDVNEKAKDHTTFSANQEKKNE